MFKMSFAVYRRPELTREAFLDYWRNVHAPLAVKHAGALRIRRYVQLHAGDYEIARMITQSRGCQPPHDGVVEIWWDSEEDRMAAAASPEGQAAARELIADELRFCDMSRATVAFGYEHVIIDN
ncbi:EthD domain-containing protein [Phenylobacterium sp.]|uniref:EthD domain-containing protein n=1 Tax=Phenylobacterium sp. TaxID=1871053 RepID=UPI002BA5A409|nr:EthD domain-containing protein [Phenylobacterium sp.]HVI33879.1 EthD domain-containing protein [Phenylobacterium sp.]